MFLLVLSWIELTLCAIITVVFTFIVIDERPHNYAQWLFIAGVYTIITIFALSSSLVIWGK